MYKIKNVATDHRYAMARRQAARMQMEPMVAGQRLRLRTSLSISDRLFELNKTDIELYKQHGVLTYEQVSVDEPVKVEMVDAPAKAEKVEAKSEDDASAASVAEEKPAAAEKSKDYGSSKKGNRR